MRRSMRIAVIAGLGLLGQSSLVSAQYHPHEKIPRIQAASRWLGVGYSHGNFAKPRPPAHMLGGGFPIPSGGLPAMQSGYAMPISGVANGQMVYESYPMTEGGMQGEWSVGGSMRPGNLHNQQVAPNFNAPAYGNPGLALPQTGGPTPAPKLAPVPRTPDGGTKSSESLPAPAETKPADPPPNWLQPYLKQDKKPMPPAPPAAPDEDLLVPDLPGNAPSVNLPEDKSPSDQIPPAKPAEAPTPPKPAASSDDDDSLIRLTPQPRLRAATRPVPRR